MNITAFEVLADPSRRRIVEALGAGERPVGDLVGKAGIRQSGVSRHLAILRESGFVSMRADGQRRLYALRPEAFGEIDAWLARVRRQWEARLDRFGEALEKRRKEKRP